MKPTKARRAIATVAYAILNNNLRYLEDWENGKLSPDTTPQVALTSLPTPVKDAIAKALRDGLHSQMKAMGLTYAENICYGTPVSETLDRLERGTSVTVNSLHLLLKEIGETE